MAEVPAEAGTWLTYSEAARATGELPDKLRGMVRRGRLQAKPPEAFNDRKARVLIPPPMMCGQGGSQAEGQGDDVAGGQGNGMADGQGAIAIVAMLRRDLADARAETAMLREEMAEARTDAALARGELAAEQRHSRSLGDTLAKAEARADRLEAELAHLRRPWLERLLEALRRR
jgi:hypothetical protein